VVLNLIIDLCLVVAEIKVKLRVHKKSALKFVVQLFNMKKLIEGNIREDCQLKITNNSAALENLNLIEWK